MNIFDPILLTILAFGIYTSYTDIKYGKIKNIAILHLLIFGLFLNIFYTGTLSKPSFILNSVFAETIINFLIALGFSFSIWLAGLWSAGDAKLFLGFSLLIPVTLYYRFGYMVFFPSLSILINTFVPAAIFYVILSFISVDKKKIWTCVKETVTTQSLTDTLLYIFGLYFVLQLALDYFNLKLVYILQIFVLFVLVEILSKISKKYLKVFSGMVSVLRLIFFYNSILAIPFLYKFFLSIAIFQALRIGITVVELSSSISVKIKSLRPGMVLEEHLIKQKEKYVKRPISVLSLVSLFKNIKDGFLSEVNRNLTEEDVKKLQSFAKEKKLDFDEINISRSVPFAQFMFIGVLLTYLLQGNLFYYLF